MVFMRAMITAKSYNVTKLNNYKLLLDDDINYEINLNHDISFLFRFKV